MYFNYKYITLCVKSISQSENDIKKSNKYQFYSI